MPVKQREGRVSWRAQCRFSCPGDLRPGQWGTGWDSSRTRGPFQGRQRYAVVTACTHWPGFTWTSCLCAVTWVGGRQTSSKTQRSDRESETSLSRWKQQWQHVVPPAQREQGCVIHFCKLQLLIFSSVDRLLLSNWVLLGMLGAVLFLWVPPLFPGLLREPRTVKARWRHVAAKVPFHTYCSSTWLLAHKCHTQTGLWSRLFIADFSFYLLFFFTVPSVERNYEQKKDSWCLDYAV